MFYFKSFIASVVTFRSIMLLSQFFFFNIWYKVENPTSFFCMSVYPLVPEKLLKRLLFIEFLAKHQLMNIAGMYCTFDSIPL